MKVTKTQLKQIIMEELLKVLEIVSSHDVPPTSTTKVWRRIRKEETDLRAEAGRIEGDASLSGEGDVLGPDDRARLAYIDHRLGELEKEKERLEDL